jgi:hypothetical protein
LTGDIDLAKVWELLDAGDVPGALRHLRFGAERLAIGDLARVVERAAALAEFDDLVAASAALAADPDDPGAQYDFGYACIERGAAYLAISPLTAALRALPDSRDVLLELVAALERMNRHADAAALLEEREATLPAWPERYLLVFNALMAGDLARAGASRLPAPEQEKWRPAYERVRRMLDRGARARQVGPLDREDLRGWQFVIGGAVLSTLAGYGFAEGMTGRSAFLQDSYGLCRHGLHRLAVILNAAGVRPRTVSLLPDRSSRILGLAAAAVLELPAEPFTPDRRDTVVVAYDLNDITDTDLIVGLRGRVPGQVLYEQATCWTEPPPVTADVSTFLVQTVVAPWGERLGGALEGSGVRRIPADDRPDAELAEEITRADGTPDAGDGQTPADPDERLAGFVTGVRELWLAGPRERLLSPGPVPSSRFL